MEDPRPHPPVLFALAVALCVLTAGPTLRAQEGPALTLDHILAQLESNLNAYEATLPSFFCDEHVESQITPSTANQDTITDGILRLDRMNRPNNSYSLDESHEIRRVNGKLANASTLNGPALLTGAFSGGFATVSVNQQACMRYAMRPVKPDHPNAPYIVQFNSLFDSKHPADCLLRESGSGSVFIDPLTMQITHLELTAPHHVIYQRSAGPGANSKSAPVIGRWTVSINYAPVPLGGRTFWMPSTIEATASDPNVPGGIPSVWFFKAQYSNYHKLEVTSRVLPPDEPLAAISQPIQNALRDPE